MKKFNEKFNETLDTLGEIGYWLGVRFERYIEENKDDILEWVRFSLCGGLP